MRTWDSTLSPAHEHLISCVVMISAAMDSKLFSDTLTLTGAESCRNHKQTRPTYLPTFNGVGLVSAPTVGEKVCGEAVCVCYRPRLTADLRRCCFRHESLKCFFLKAKMTNVILIKKWVSYPTVSLFLTK